MSRKIGYFHKTIESVTKKFKYARYTPLLYLKEGISHPEELAQKNMGKFMKILLVKRLESSFQAFKNTLQRFIRSYEHFLAQMEKGRVYVSKKYINKIFEFLENDNDEAIERLIEEDKAASYDAADFKKEFKRDLEHDLQLLKDLSRLWETMVRDPKISKFLEILKTDPVLGKNKTIIFTESKETAEYLDQKLRMDLGDELLTVTGSSSALIRERVIENFDPGFRFPKDDYRILVSTEVLSEGVNLHRANVVVNYDIPWNPTRLIQRVGRINRVDTKFDTIYTYNFFPTRQSNDQIKLKEAAEYKIQAFIEMLGADARLLTEGEEIKSHDLFSRLLSKKTITGEDETEESELKYLQVIRRVRDQEPDTFARIKNLPKKARTARTLSPSPHPDLLTYFRKGKLQKFFIAARSIPQGIGFFSRRQTVRGGPRGPQGPF